MLKKEVVYKAVQALYRACEGKSEDEIINWFDSLSLQEHNEVFETLSDYLYQKRFYEFIAVEQFILAIKDDAAIGNKKEDVLKALIKDSITGAISNKLSFFPGLELEMVLNE